MNQEINISIDDISTDIEIDNDKSNNNNIKKKEHQNEIQKPDTINYEIMYAQPVQNTNYDNYDFGQLYNFIGLLILTGILIGLSILFKHYIEHYTVQNIRLWVWFRIASSIPSIYI